MNCKGTGSSYDLIRVLYQHLPGGIHKNFQYYSDEPQANMKFYLDSQGSTHTGAAVHTGWILAAVVVGNKKVVPKADTSFLLDHVHYLNNMKQWSQWHISR